MKMKQETEEYITDLAEKEYAAGRKMTATDLAQRMRQDGITLHDGRPYQGRAVYTSLGATWRRRAKKARRDQSDKIAHVFTMPNGRYAYE